MKAITWNTTTATPEETEAVAERLGGALRGGEVLELVSDLGGGKTTFVRGLARGMGSKDVVGSPTFAISKLYTAGNIYIHHFDFYRLHEPGIIANELAEVAGDAHIVTVIEWADVVQYVLPEEHITVTIAQTPEGSRLLTFHCPSSAEYIQKATQG